MKSVVSVSSEAEVGIVGEDKGKRRRRVTEEEKKKAGDRRRGEESRAGACQARLDW